MKIVNIAFYYFFEMAGDLEKKRLEVKELCLRLGLKGTVILSPEGINLMVAGERNSICEFQDYLRSLIGSDHLFFKESDSDYIPFNRMRVKVKQHAIAMNTKVYPQMNSASHIEPEALKRWLDEKRDFILLDARNRFEYEVGTFEGAVRSELDHFRDFESYLTHLPEDWKEKPIVTFCTGGIRCEKVVPLLEMHGFKKVYQLNGGILNYFEKIGRKYFRGDCFVFDGRVSLNPAN